MPNPAVAEANRERARLAKEDDRPGGLRLFVSPAIKEYLTAEAVREGRKPPRLLVRQMESSA
jgi:hypothetical protein